MRKKFFPFLAIMFCMIFFIMSCDKKANVKPVTIPFASPLPVDSMVRSLIDTEVYIGTYIDTLEPGSYYYDYPYSQSDFKFYVIHIDTLHIVVTTLYAPLFVQDIYRSDIPLTDTFMINKAGIYLSASPRSGYWYYNGNRISSSFQEMGVDSFNINNGLSFQWEYAYAPHCGDGNVRKATFTGKKKN